MENKHFTIKEVSEGLRKKRFSCEEITNFYLSKIKKRENKLHAFLSVMDKTAIKQAKEIDKKIKKGEKLPFLAGVPVAIKDNIVTKGIKTTASSKILEDYVPPFDATVIAKLKQSDYLLLGKTNCDEFAMGASTEHSAFGPTQNPWDITRVPGGSSGGSAAAVASNECVYALGTDTGGSVRQPAAFCGLVGLKPTYGRISRHGLIAMASSFDQAGILSKTVEDAAQVLKVIAGYDAKDATAVETPVPDYSADLSKKIKGLKVGVPKEFFSQGL
ncbi:MAG: amidase, partial [bacterium]